MGLLLALSTACNHPTTIGYTGNISHTRNTIVLAAFATISLTRNTMVLAAFAPELAAILCLSDLPSLRYIHFPPPWGYKSFELAAGAEGTKAAQHTQSNNYMRP